VPHDHGRGALIPNVIQSCAFVVLAVVLGLPTAAQSTDQSRPLESDSNKSASTSPSPTNPPESPRVDRQSSSLAANDGAKVIGSFLGSFAPTIDGFPTALASATGTPDSDLGMVSFNPNELHLITPGLSGSTLFTRNVSSTTTNAASGIAIDFDSGGAGLPTVFISDAANAEIDVYDGSGSFLYDFPTVGGFFVEGCTFNPITGHIYVVDLGTPDVIRQYTPAGSLVQTYPLAGAPMHSTDGLAYDNERNVYWVYDRVADVVSCYDTNFNLDMSFSPDVIGITGSQGEGIGVVGDVLYIASWVTGTVLSFDILMAGKAPNCSSFSTFLQAEWPLLEADLGLPGIHIPATPGRRIPERYALGMVQAIICIGDHPDLDRLLQAYQINLASLESESEPQLSRVAPYKHALAALLLVSQIRQDYFVNELGLVNVYTTVRSLGGKALDEPFSDEGDLDADGLSNGDEYDNVIASGGLMPEFLVAVLNPNLMGAALPAMDRYFAGLLVFLLLALGIAFQVNRTRPRSKQSG